MLKTHAHVDFLKTSSLRVQFPPFKTHISWDKFLILMLSLGMTIDKKHHALMKALSSALNAI